MPELELVSICLKLVCQRALYEPGISSPLAARTSPCRLHPPPSHSACEGSLRVCERAFSVQSGASLVASAPVQASPKVA